MSIIKEEIDVKKEPKSAKAKNVEVGKKRTHRQARTSRFLDVEAKEEDSEEEDNRRTTRKSDLKSEPGK